jgi:CRISPR-associated protein Cas2
MVVIVTRDVAARFRGFLASCMLEIAPGVYTAPKMSAAVRERVWGVLQEWWGTLSKGSIVMTWNSTQETAGQGLASLGIAPKKIVEYEGLHLVVRLEEARPAAKSGL